MDDLGTLLLLSTGAFLIAGTVKGAVGIGLPTTAIGLMTLAIDPRTAIALILVPMIVSNAWQVDRSGEILAAARRYLPFAAALISPGTPFRVAVCWAMTANASRAKAKITMVRV